MNYQCLIFDPIDFRGGSKVAVETIFAGIASRHDQTLVLSNDKKSWIEPYLVRQSYWFPKALSQAMHGLPFLLKHCMLAITIIATLLKHRQIKVVVATSGPGIDLGLYLARAVVSSLRPMKLVQLVQGPVAESGLSARCLASADWVFYLENTKPDLIRLQDKLTATTNSTLSPKYQLMKNGLAESNWPSPTEYRENRIFWAASNLKWKGLDLLVQMLRRVNQSLVKVTSDICYIPADDQGMAVSDTNIPIAGVAWHEMPDDLDAIRKQANIFISTSSNEPFGLSILEAMAAGLCVIIPSDGAYWDKRLENQINCIKYMPNDAQSLTNAVIDLLQQPDLTKQIGQAAKQLATEYAAQKRYQNIHQTILKEVRHVA